MILLALLFSFTAHANPDDWAKENLAWDIERRHIASTASDIGLFSLVGGSIIYTAINQKEKRWQHVSGAVAAHALNQGLNQAVKHLVGRERPDASDNKSFYSGHSSSSALSGILLCKQNRKLCGPALGLAGLTAYLRVGANRHWLSDIGIGLMAGTVNGLLIPQVIIKW